MGKKWIIIITTVITSSLIVTLWSKEQLENYIHKHTLVYGRESRQSWKTKFCLISGLEKKKQTKLKMNKQ